jgi:hypothetical protein
MIPGSSVLNLIVHRYTVVNAVARTFTIISVFNVMERSAVFASLTNKHNGLHRYIFSEALLSVSVRRTVGRPCSFTCGPLPVGSSLMAPAARVKSDRPPGPPLSFRWHLNMIVRSWLTGVSVQTRRILPPGLATRSQLNSTSLFAHGAPAKTVHTRSMRQCGDVRAVRRGPGPGGPGPGPRV